MNITTQDMKFRQSLMNYVKKYVVSQAENATNHVRTIFLAKAGTEVWNPSRSSHADRIIILMSIPRKK